MSYKNSKKIILFILSVAIAYEVGSNIYYWYQMKNYSTYAIGKVTSFKYQESNAFAEYHFYLGGSKIKGATYLRNEVNDFWINKYFKVKYSSENPEINDILIDEMVTDVEAVKAAGFELKYDKVQNP